MEQFLPFTTINGLMSLRMLAILRMLVIVYGSARYSILLAGPSAQIGHLAALRAEWTVTIRGTQFRGLFANWTTHC